MKSKPREFIEIGIRVLWQQLMIASGWLLVLGGVVVTPLPIPLGIIMLICGFALLTWQSHFCRMQLFRLRKRYSRFSHAIRLLTPRLPRRLRQAVALTDPVPEPPTSSDVLTSALLQTDQANQETDTQQHTKQ